MSAAVHSPFHPARRAFPVLRARRVGDTAAFYERLGFATGHRHPAKGEPDFVTLRRHDTELAVSRDDRAADGAPGTVDLFVFVEAVDATVAALRAEGTPVVQEPENTPWGERVAYVRDPAGNRVGLGQPAA
ncbi:glyoxalase/bleomycin resistance/extradiol dioxygenase family protein [Streptomyces sp. WAC06614]|uniref:VOC family protein n=1 Tax=Streptomyces sp. WAC06614 TaxID=2487416 RepID=UPI000F7A5E78|nr:VOC family protein [Streptomyces sp. WAC06614]RSS78564.1 glyoxalase/bleomycin resistance/dioxygenase family protein [Streptomyces sp. WAC06614]